MRKNDMEKKWNDTDIRNFLQRSAKEQEIPKNLHPRQMEEWLKGQTADQTGKEENGKGEEQSNRTGLKKNKYFRWWCGSFAAAACMALVLFAVGRNIDWKLELPMERISHRAGRDDDSNDVGVVTEEGTTYKKLYQTFDRVWKEQEKLYFDQREYAVSENTDTAVDDAAEGASGAELAAPAEDAAESSGAENAAPAEGMTESGAAEQTTEKSTEDYGRTNQQEEEVEEADVIKNDGRYLYQAILHKTNGRYTVRIADTEGGLKETARVGNFETVDNIYVWEDKLVILEPGWAESPGSDTGNSEDDRIPGYAYCRIHIYDISDRGDPKEEHTFTVKGSYKDSRIYDGYLYFFASCDTSRPGKEENISAYVPMLDGTPMAEDKIFLPEDASAASYLVMVSVDMERPDRFVDTKALVTAADKFYVSQKNIYVADSQNFSYGKKGENTDSTRIYRYSYKDGRMNKEAEGAVNGTLRDDMAMNEYQDYLRMVTTVENGTVEEVIDDVSGETIGYDTAEIQTSNSLYVLDQNLQVAGKIEELARNERIYSARFMGSAGYFVTFRETDPLFSVDLSNPREPKILGELKISGFSEYLHFYSDGLLFGLGMEADENTGETHGMKLSMFDISNPADVKEQSKLNLPEYDYSDALYDYKAVLIDPKKNLFGFSVEGYGEDYGRSYLLFSYENGEFQQILNIDCSEEDRWGWRLRGTYIKDRFFLMAEDGRIEEYSLADKKWVRALEP